MAAAGDGVRIESQKFGQHGVTAAETDAEPVPEENTTAAPSTAEIRVVQETGECEGSEHELRVEAQQIEGAVIFGLSAALYGRIDIERGVVRQDNFPSYRVLTLAETPPIETHLVPSTRSPIARATMRCSR